MITISNVEGTCIARYVRLNNPKVWPKSADELAPMIIGHNLLFCVTTKEQEEFRNMLVELGFSSNEVDGCFHHVVDSNNITNPMFKTLIYWIEEGEKLSAKEGRQPNELRVGDRVVYGGGYNYSTQKNAFLQQSLQYLNNTMLIKGVDAQFVTDWGPYTRNHWYNWYFKRIPLKLEKSE